jgi:hypothetical protein
MGIGIVQALCSLKKKHALGHLLGSLEFINVTGVALELYLSFNQRKGILEGE